MSETSALLKRPRGAPAPAHHVRTRAACGQDEGAVRAPGAGLAPRPRAGPASGHPAAAGRRTGAEGEHWPPSLSCDFHAQDRSPRPGTSQRDGRPPEASLWMKNGGQLPRDRRAGAVPRARFRGGSSCKRMGHRSQGVRRRETKRLFP